VLLLFVRNVRPQTDAPRTVEPAPSTDAGDSRRTRSLVALAIAATILSLATISDAFVYLLLQRRAGFNTHLFPLMYIGTAASYLLLAIPAGQLADRFGRRAMFIAGHVCLIALYVVIIRTDLDAWTVIGCLLLLGAYYAATDGVLMALATGVCRADRRASGMAAITTCTSGARFLAPIAFGAIWTTYSAQAAVTVFGCALVVALVAASAILLFECRSCEIDVERAT